VSPNALIERNAENILALRLTARRGKDISAELEPVIEDLRGAITPVLPKRVAARLLGVSVPTLNKWIVRGWIPATESRPQKVLRDPLLDVALQVRQLRRAGQVEGVLAQAIHRLQAEDPDYQRQAQELYGASLAAMEKGDLVPATIPDGFGPND
jgi:hypothetical protein